MATAKTRVGIVGVSGYTGLVLLELLLDHKNVEVVYVSAGNTTGKITDMWPHLTGKTNLVCVKYDKKQVIKSCDTVFLAVPHTIAMKLVPPLLKAGLVVIDLSGDYRLGEKTTYKKWYKTTHTDTANLQKAAYGLSEIYRAQIKKASLISNPGCYATAAILALAPLMKGAGQNIDSIIIDAKSGVTGAGRRAHTSLLYSEISENFRAYKVFAHQHNPEIDLYLGRLANKPVSTTFITHLLPINRGILETIYVKFKKPIKESALRELYKKYYIEETFIRLLPVGVQPETRNVRDSNYCDLALSINDHRDTLVITAAIDNLVKGASGQAVQNMNIRFGFREDEGLL